MANKTLTDAQAKAGLRKWPERTSLWGTPRANCYWIRAQPKDLKSKETAPTLRIPGANLFTTQPDGMWIYLSESDYADVICIESCGGIQNLNDKRSRYMPSVGSVVLLCPLPWLVKEISLQKSGKKPRWQAMGSISTEPKEPFIIPVRHLRVLFTLPNDLYKAWSANSIPGAHEYFCRHSSLTNFAAPVGKAFLRRLAFTGHFFTQLGR